MHKIKKNTVVDNRLVKKSPKPKPGSLADPAIINLPKLKKATQLQGIMPIIIENITPSIDEGMFAAKCIVNDHFDVAADIFKDGHGVLKAVIKYRRADDSEWKSAPMSKGLGDKWSGYFIPKKNCRYEYTIQAWVDPIETWVSFMRKKCPANANVYSDLAEGILFLNTISKVSEQIDQSKVKRLSDLLTLSEGSSDEVLKIICSDTFVEVTTKYPIKKYPVDYHQVLKLIVDRKEARYSAWYEMFPRSQSKTVSAHGNFNDCTKRLPDIKRMGFDVIYLPPIHPIGRTNRKGANNSLKSDENSPGSPWAIGAKEGGHKALLPELGTMKDFTKFVRAANDYGIEIALDLAYQCSPDHPYVKEHPEWFFRLPDGTIRYAENPPKKYQDIYPINFYGDDYADLWNELKSVVVFWIKKGVKIFRVDNPHTKPLRFWLWLIQEIQQEYPEVIFLAEAFTRPEIMRYLAKAGFSQSYTYFTWRNSKSEIQEYMHELTTTEMKDYFRGNFFANTPDILPEYLQHGGMEAFKIRLVLAATLSPCYGIYSGFEFGENKAIHAGSEEYLDSEKYEIKHRNWDQTPNIKTLIGRVNTIRRQNIALHSFTNLEFYDSCNGNILCFGKRTANNDNIIIVVVNLDPGHVQEDMITLPLWKFGIKDWEVFQVKDLITGDKYYWKGARNYIRLDPQKIPAHILRVKK